MLVGAAAAAFEGKEVPVAAVLAVPATAATPAGTVPPPLDALGDPVLSFVFLGVKNIIIMSEQLPRAKPKGAVHRPFMRALASRSFYT